MTTTAKKGKKQLTPEQIAARQQRRETLVARAKELEAKIKAKKEDGTFSMQEFYDMYARLSESTYSYSFGNAIMIFLQCSHASKLRSFQAWKAEGYKVKKGEHGIEIMAPHERKRQEGDEEEDGKKLGFHFVYVFDISQVEPDPAAERNER